MPTDAMPAKPAGKTERGLTMQEMAAQSGLSEHTLRYYENIGLLTTVPRDTSSGHRRYSPEAVRLVEILACLHGAGMSISDIRTYLKQREYGAAAAAEQKALFASHEASLARKMEVIQRQRQYLAGKVAYWDAVERGDMVKAEEISAANYLLAAALTETDKEK